MTSSTGRFVPDHVATTLSLRQMQGSDALSRPEPKTKNLTAMAR